MRPIHLIRFSLLSLLFFTHSVSADPMTSSPSNGSPAQQEAIISAPGSGPVISSPPSTTFSPCRNTPCEKVFHPPAFKVVFHNNSGQTHILVPSKTTFKQLENLIYYLSEERKNNGLEKTGIPPNGSGDYSRGSILVFNEIKWARGEKLTNPKIREKTYSRKVLAEYIWNNHNETAYIGQKNLFSNSTATQK